MYRFKCEGKNDVYEMFLVLSWKCYPPNFYKQQNFIKSISLFILMKNFEKKILGM